MDIRAAILSPTAPTPGALLGTTGSAAVLQSVRDSLGSSRFFGTEHDRFAPWSNRYIETVLQPIRQAAATVVSAVNALIRPDTIRPLVTFEDLSFVPPAMQLPIVLDPMVRQLLEQGRIAGFGFNPEWLPPEDVYGRLIANGTVEDVGLARDPTTGEVEQTWVWETGDPVLSFEEQDAIEDTRAYVHHLITTSAYDPTDLPAERG